MGLIGYLLSYQAMFLIAAALCLPLFVGLAAIRPADIDFARSCGAPHPDAPSQRARTTHRSLWKTPGVLTFAVGLFLFQLANAAMSIASRYAELVEDAALREKIFSRLRKEWEATVRALLAITEQETLLQGNPLLARSIRNGFLILTRCITSKSSCSNAIAVARATSVSWSLFIFASTVSPPVCATAGEHRLTVASTAPRSPCNPRVMQSVASRRGSGQAILKCRGSAPFCEQQQAPW